MGNKRRAATSATSDTINLKRRLPAYRQPETLLDLDINCTQIIFEHLTPIDLCRMQDAFPHLAELADRAFKNVLQMKPSWSKFEMGASTSDASCIFKHFGHLFRSLHVCGSIGNDTLKRVTQLTSLVLENVNIDGNMVQKLYTGMDLESLDFINCKFVISRGGNSRRKNSSLLRLTFQQTLPPLTFFAALLNNSERLQCLGIPIDLPADGYIQHIRNYATEGLGSKGVTEFMIFVEDSSHNSTIPNVLSNYRHLSKLSVTGRNTLNVCATPLLDSINQIVPKLDHLEMKGFTFKASALQMLSKMKNLRRVAVRGMVNCETNELVSMVASLPLITNLTLSFEGCCSLKSAKPNVSLSVVKDLVTAGKELNCLQLLHVSGMQIENKLYSELVELLEGANRKMAVAVVGCGSTSSLDIPLNVRRSNVRHWIVDYGSDGVCGCKVDGLICSSLV